MSKFTDHTGETNTAKNGLKMTIIAYRGCKDMDIQFEDGIIVYNKQYIEFKRGIIKHPTINTTNVKATKKYVGETNIANNGLKITIIAYRRWNDIDIQFEDGTIVKHKTYPYFKNGSIGHPTINTTNAKSTKNHVGETNIAKNGMTMTIIAYKNNKDIDIQFEDGIIICNQYYSSFKKGQIKHPNINTHKAKAIAKHANEVRTMNCGLKATIINYYSNKNIDIQFENNIITHNKKYGAFKNGSIKMPDIINTIKLKGFAYKLNNDWYYICSHPTWTEDKILSVKEIYAYKLK